MSKPIFWKKSEVKVVSLESVSIPFKYEKVLRQQIKLIQFRLHILRNVHVPRHEIYS